MAENLKFVTYWTSRDGGAVFCLLIIVFTIQKRARNRANFHCCRLEQHGVIEVWLQIVSADKFGTVMLAHGLEMVLLNQRQILPDLHHMVNIDAVVLGLVLLVCTWKLYQCARIFR